MSARLAFWYAVLLLLLLSLLASFFSFPSDLEAVMNAATITVMKISILRAIEYVIDTTDTAVQALREIPFNYYVSIVTAFVAQVFQEVIRFGTTTIKTISSLPYSKYATTGVSVTHQILRTGEEMVSWFSSQLGSASQAIEIMFDPSTAQMIVFAMYAVVLALVYVIVRGIFNVFWLLWRTARFIACIVLCLVYIFTPRRQRHNRNWDIIPDATPIRTLAPSAAPGGAPVGTPDIPTTDLLQRITNLIED